MEVLSRTCASFAFSYLGPTNFQLTCNVWEKLSIGLELSYFSSFYILCPVLGIQQVQSLHLISILNVSSTYHVVVYS